MGSRKGVFPGSLAPYFRGMEPLGSKGSQKEPSKFELGSTAHSATLRAFWWESWYYGKYLDSLFAS